MFASANRNTRCSHLSIHLPVVECDAVLAAFSTPKTALSLSRWGFVQVKDHQFHLFLPSRRGVSTEGNKSVFAAGVFASYADARTARDDIVTSIASDTVCRGVQWGPHWGLKIWHSVLGESHEHAPGCSCCFCDYVLALLTESAADEHPPDVGARCGAEHATSRLPSVSAALKAAV